MRLLVGITGRVGSGKTTFIEAADYLDDVRGVYPGRACRAKWGAAAFAAEGDPAAPEFAESFVRGLVSDAAAVAERIVLVDGMPRTTEQVGFLAEAAISHNRVPLILMLDAPAGVLSLRLRGRDEGLDEAALSTARLFADALLLDVIMAAAKAEHVETYRITNAPPGLEAYQDRAATLVCGLLEDAEVDDETLSIFCALAGVL